jgi:hypothetical protein
MAKARSLGSEYIQASIVYQFHSIEILQTPSPPMPIPPMSMPPEAVAEAAAAVVLILIPPIPPMVEVPMAVVWDAIAVQSYAVGRIRGNSSKLKEKFRNCLVFKQRLRRFTSN